MKLYCHPNSTYARRVRIIAEEKGLSLELIFVAMEKKEHRSKDFLKLNPYGRLPVLDDQGFILAESSVIMSYIEMKHPEPPVYPSEIQKRAHVDQWIHQCDIEFAGPATGIYFSKRFLPKERWDYEDMKKSAKKIQRHFKILSDLLGESAYMLDDFSAVEIAYAPFLQFRELLELEIPENVESWSKRILERPSVVSSFPPA